MFHEVETTAKNLGCEQIEAFCYPYGRFSHGTEDFYKRNGFSFMQTPLSKTYAVKKLNTQTLKNEIKEEKTNQ